MKKIKKIVLLVIFSVGIKAEEVRLEYAIGQGLEPVRYTCHYNYPLTYERLRNCVVEGFDLSLEVINTLSVAIMYPDDPIENIYVSLGNDSAGGVVEEFDNLDLEDFIIDIVPNPELELVSGFSDYSSSEDEF